MADKFNRYRRELDSPASYAASIVPHNSNDLPTASRAIYVGGAGDISLVTAEGQSVTFKAVPVGLILPIRAKRVLSTGTTASNLIAMA